VYKEDLMDAIVHVTIQDLFVLSKDGKIIKLSNFSFKNKSHLAILSISALMRNIFNFDIEIESDFFSYWFYNLKHKYKKFCKRVPKVGDGINVDLLINNIENLNNLPSIFSEIYEKYYKGE